MPAVKLLPDPVNCAGGEVVLEVPPTETVIAVLTDLIVDAGAAPAVVLVTAATLPPVVVDPKTIAGRVVETLAAGEEATTTLLVVPVGTQDPGIAVVLAVPETGQTVV